jgi:metacaspase-1
VKRFIAVGINDYPEAPLSGCVNDADDWASVLEDRGFSGYTLLDQDATGANIRAGLRDMLLQSYWGDTIILTFSGHGTWLPDSDDDESDRRDEALVPYDYEYAPLVTDDVLFRLVSENRATGVKTLIISDSCHSGTVSRAVGLNDRAPYIREPSTPSIRFLPPTRTLPSDWLGAAERVQYAPKAPKLSRTGAALLAACADSEVAWDAPFGGRPNGAFTRAAVDTLNNTNPRSLHSWLGSIRAKIAYSQTPQLVGTWYQRHMSRWL